MSTQRYNPFDFIHKALRAMLYDTALALQQADFGDREAAEPVLQKVEYVLKAMWKHAKIEDGFIMPVVQQYDSMASAMFEEEHSKDESLTDMMLNKIEAFRFSSSEQARVQHGRDLLYLYIEFVAFNLIHMNKEEHLINEILWQHYSDEELMAFNQQIARSIPDEESAEIMQWMIRGISNMELTILLTGLKCSPCIDLFNAMMKSAEDFLPEERWNKVKETITEGVSLS